MDHLLIYLLNSKDYVSGEKLAEKFDITRTAVWKHIGKMKQLGLIIESVPKKGYKILSCPVNKIIPEMVQFYYQGKLPYDLVVLGKTESTNSFVKRMLADGEKSDIVVLSEEQAAGRGRMQRKWQSEKNRDLTFTLGLSVNKAVGEFYQFTILTALSVYQVMSRMMEADSDQLKIKWPNDIYYRNKKLCGILSEMITEEAIIKNIIIGIGINVNSVPKMPGAVSLKSIMDMELDRNKILADIIRAVKSNFDSYREGGYGQIFREWKSHLGWLGSAIKIDTGREVIEGVLSDINADGSVIIEKDGVKMNYYSGDLIV